MADLVAQPAWGALELPVTAGGVTLAAAAQEPMLSIAPLRSHPDALAEALGTPLPPAGRVVVLEDGSALIWAGLDQWLLRGPSATPELAARLDGRAAVADQSDGWAEVGLTGTGAGEVLARLVPIDLDPAVFNGDIVARTELRHIMCVLRARADGFGVMVMRSFTATAVREIVAAMRAVDARRRLAPPAPLGKPPDAAG